MNVPCIATVTSHSNRAKLRLFKYLMCELTREKSSRVKNQFILGGRWLPNLHGNFKLNEFFYLHLQENCLCLFWLVPTRQFSFEQKPKNIRFNEILMYFYMHVADLHVICRRQSKTECDGWAKILFIDPKLHQQQQHQPRKKNHNGGCEFNQDIREASNDDGISLVNTTKKTNL